MADTEVFVPTEEEESEESDALETPAAERDALIRAAEEAGAESEESESDRDEKGRFKKPAEAAKPPVQAPKKKPEGEAPSSVIARELARRSERRQEENGYRAKIQEAETLLARAQEQAQAVVQERQAYAAKMKEVDDLLSTIRRDPMGAMQKMGWTAEQFIRNAERQNDPNYQELVTMQGELAKRDEMIDKLTRRLDRLDEVETNYAQQAQQRQAAAEVEAFWSSLPEDSPLFTDDRFEDRDDILLRARKVRQKYFEVTAKKNGGRGKVASPEEVAQYLHYEALQRRNGAPAGTAGQKPGQAGQTKAKVPRALGSRDATERLGGQPKHVHDMTPAEERQFLMDVANQAIAED